MGRVFGVREMVDCCAFAIAFVAAGAVASAFGARPLFVLTGTACFTICAAAAWALRSAWAEDTPGSNFLPAESAPAG